MRGWGVGALCGLVVLLVGCSSNSTPVQVLVTTTTSGATTTSVTLLESTSAQFVATVTGATSTVVYWQICMPTSSTTTAPTNCSQGVGPQQCVIPLQSMPLTGFGTITMNGLYTAPNAPPQPDSFWIVATSCVDTTKFGAYTVTVDSGIRVTVTPSTATVGSTETFQFNATVTGTANTAVSWLVCGAGGSNTPLNCAPSGTVGPNGSITATGLYTAPASTGSAIVQAVSAADQNQDGTAGVSISAQAPPTLSTSPTSPPLVPARAAQGSVQQDVYITGTNFYSTTNVVAGGVVLPTANFVLISSTLLRATIPGPLFARAGTLQVGVQDQKGNQATAPLTVMAVRPVVLNALPSSVPQSTAATPTVLLTGGFFSPNATTATFNGQSASATVATSGLLSLAIPSGDVTTPGLYPIVVTNSGITPGQPSESALNLQVTPVPAAIPGAPSATTVSVGLGPSAVAIDERNGIAVVANTGGGTISLINVVTQSAIGVPILVGHQPTGVAVDDLLPDPIALVVNNGDFTVSAIDLKTQSLVGAPLSVAIGPTSTSPMPFSIGINPLTHRALVAYSSTNEATVLDLSTGRPVIVQQVGGGNSLIGTGANPAVAIDPRLNWAVVTPGGSGAVSLVDLGVNTGPGQPAGRSPQLVGALAESSSTQGIGIDTQAHTALLSNPQAGTLITVDLLDETVTTVTSGGASFNQKGFGAAAASLLENVGIAVSGSSSGAASAVIVNLQNGTVLQTVGGFGSANLQAVAVDPVTNQAVAVDQANNKVYFVSLGAALNPVQIVEANPAIIFGGPNVGNTSLTVVGSGFVSGSALTLDGSPLATTFVSSRELTAVVPGGAGGLLGVPRNFAVQVQNPSNVVSNVTDLTVILPVAVGNAPIGVAIDTDRDLAVVTNSADGTVSLIALTPETPTGQYQTPAGSIGVIGGPITVGTEPQGVAEIPRLGLALVANNGSNDASIVDVTETKVPTEVPLCGAQCSAPVGVAVNQDSATGVITNTNPGSSTTLGSVSLIDVTAASATLGPTLDHDPVAVAIDPNPQYPYAAVATDSSTSSIDFLNIAIGGALVGRTPGLSNPTGIVFDPVNQVFLVANSLQNEVVIIDPTSFLPTPVAVGIGPASLDYNYQTRTLVTVNSISHTMSILAYTCPPSLAAPACTGPQVATVVGLGGTQATAPVFGPNAIAVDPILNLAVLIDEDNNQVLLIPLPH
jgi:DNA-binding beta-propeller fold protein YncE